MTHATQAEMFSDLKSPERQELSSWSQAQEIVKLGLVPQELAWKVLNVSKGRMSQFVQEDRFRTWDFFGKTWLSLDDLTAFSQMERKNGRPGVKMKSI